MPPDTTTTARPTRRLSSRLVLGGLAAALVAVPFTLLMVLVLGESEELEQIDHAIADSVHDQVLPKPWLREAFEALSVATDPNVWRVLAVVIAVVLWRRGRRRVVAWLVTTMAVGGLLVPLLKQVVARARPEFDEPLATASGYSFPSGHALNSMLFAGVIVVLAHAYTRRRVAVWLAALVIVLVTAVDRVGLGVHYASDVLAGWVVGLATVIAMTAAFQQRGNPS